MRATLNMARGAAGAAIAGAQNYTETTIDVLRYLVLRTYFVTLAAAIPVGLIGDLLGYRHLGYLPGCIGFLLVSYFWWVFEARLLAADISAQVLPDWLQKRVANWSTKEHHSYKVFFGSSTVGLWIPCLLWVPAELPVWRHPIHYLGALCVTMAITQFVATMQDGFKFWRHFYGLFVVAFAIRHGLGFLGYEVEDLWAQAGNISLPSLGPVELGFIAAGLVLIAMAAGKSNSSAGAH